MGWAKIIALIGRTKDLTTGASVPMPTTSINVLLILKRDHTSRSRIFLDNITELHFDCLKNLMVYIIIFGFVAHQVLVISKDWDVLLGTVVCYGGCLIYNLARVVKSH